MKTIKKFCLLLLSIILILFITGNPPVVLIGDNIIFAYKTKYDISEYDSSIKYLKNTRELSLNFDFHGTDSDFDLSFLKNMKKIERLNLNINPEYTDFSPVSSCENLEIFQSGYGIDDLSFLSSLTKLKHIEINPFSYSVCNIEFVRNLKNLESLSLPLDGKSDYSVLEELPNFKSITIGENCGDLTALLNNEKIEKIKIHTKNADLSVSIRENNVKYLGCYDVKNTSYLKNFPKLEELVLFSGVNGMVDLKSIKNNKNLKSFKLMADEGIDCSINLSDLKEISTLENIELVNVNVLDEESISKFKEKGIIVKIEK